MSAKKLKTTLQGEVINHPKLTSKAKPKPYIEPTWLRNYRLERELYFMQKYPHQEAEIESIIEDMKREWNIQDKRK